MKRLGERITGSQQWSWIDILKLFNFSSSSNRMFWLIWEPFFLITELVKKSPACFCTLKDFCANVKYIVFELKCFIISHFLLCTVETLRNKWGMYFEFFPPLKNIMIEMAIRKKVISLRCFSLFFSPFIFYLLSFESCKRKLKTWSWWHLKEKRPTFAFFFSEPCLTPPFPLLVPS